jgi:hypothetical protein
MTNSFCFNIYSPLPSFLWEKFPFYCFSCTLTLSAELRESEFKFNQCCQMRLLTLFTYVMALVQYTTWIVNKPDFSVIFAQEGLLKWDVLRYFTFSSQTLSYAPQKHPLTVPGTGTYTCHLVTHLCRKGFDQLRWSNGVECAVFDWSHFWQAWVRSTGSHAVLFLFFFFQPFLKTQCCSACMQPKPHETLKSPLPLLHIVNMCRKGLHSYSNFGQMGIGLFLARLPPLDFSPKQLRFLLGMKP